MPLMAMIRHRAASGSHVPTYLLYSSHYYKEISYREELERLATEDRSLEVFYTLTRCRPEEDQYVQQPCSNPSEYPEILRKLAAREYAYLQEFCKL